MRQHRRNHYRRRLTDPGSALASAQHPPSPTRPGRRMTRQDVLVTAARSTCAFDVQENVVEDRERYRTTATYPDGTPKEQVFRGDLVMLVHQHQTGASVVHDLGGTGVFEYNPDGTPASLTSSHGRSARRSPPAARPTPASTCVAGKAHSVTFNADGTRTSRSGRAARSIDVCAELD